MMTLVRPQTFTYAQRGQASLDLDLYHPGGGPAPLVLFGYGGGFTKGSKDANVHQPLAQRLCAAGFAVALPDYRLKTSPEHVDPETFAQITRIANRVERLGWGVKRKLFDVRLYTACEDLSDALKFCRAHSDQMQIAGSKIGMMGISAGGLAGNTLCYAPRLWRNRFDSPDVMVSLCAPVVHPWRIREKGVPTYVLHGRKDRIIPVASSATTAETAQVTGAPITVTMPPDAPHIGIDTYVLSRHSASGQLYIDDIVDHLRKHMGVRGR
ncbi:alpha/beta hydrolase [Tateyamaria sp. Alg231-49]|uniref:alpha/beta hydrolase n=1 Tax=Tateyamaria sp. Alg231-49 TaxID=1922219 RepID=UPI000D54DFA2|nr:alpha/beta hydrolase fold domain-containing protein [Tateyamaria sp. Alg231-49]